MKVLRSHKVLLATVLVSVLVAGVAVFVKLRPVDGSPQQDPAVVVAARQTMANLLEHSWATNGVDGYFIDDAGLPGTAMSLYDTAWWQQAITGKPDLEKRLDRESVAKWILPILYGSADGAGSGDTSSAPRLAVIEAAVGLAIMMQIPIDTGAVAQQIEDLRVGALYKSQAKAPGGDWGSTGLAMRILGAIKQRPPGVVASNVQAHIAKALVSRQAEELFARSIPVLTSMDHAQVAGARRDLEDQLAWVESLLPAMTPIERITAAGALAPLLGAIGKAWPITVVCQGLLITPEGVKISEQTLVDARATATAVKAGCVPGFTPPPWTPDGWPNRQSVTGALQASIAGARIASAAGVLETYRPQLARSLLRHWSPPLNTGQGALLGTAMLSRILQIPWVSPLGSDALVEAITSDNPAQAVPVLLIGWLNQDRVALQTPNAASNRAQQGGASIFVAVAGELRYRLTGEQRYRQDSRAMLGLLSAGPSLYAANWREGNPKEPSVVATAIAAWILGQNMPVDALQSAGLCDSQLSCGANTAGHGSPIDSPLRATAAVLALVHPDSAGFPLAF